MPLVTGTLLDNGGQVVNVKHPDFGAVGDGRVNDGPAIQKAVNAAAGGTVLFPAGRYRILAPIVVGAGTSLRGVGVASELLPQSCGCFTWPVHHGISPAVVADLFVHGTGCEQFVALHAAGTDDPAARVTGLRIERVYVAFYGTAVQWRGVWHASIRDCTFNNVHQGVSLLGRCVKIVVDGCAMTRGTARIAGAGPSRGVACDSTFDYRPTGKSEARPEDVQVGHNLIFGFDVGIDWQRALFGACDANDLDACAQCGVRVQQSDGGLRLTGNWIALADAGARGIQLIPLGFVSTGHTLIQGNSIAHNGAPSPAGSRAIEVGANQQNVTIQANQTRGFGGADCHIDGARRVRVLDNDFRSTGAGPSLSVVAAHQIAVERNALARPVSVDRATSAGVSVGEQYGPP